MRITGWIHKHLGWGRSWSDPVVVPLSWRDLMVELDPALALWRPERH
jgi:hypothetical protein